MIEVTSTEFVKRFAEHRREAQQEPVAVTHHGQPTKRRMMPLAERLDGHPR